MTDPTTIQQEAAVPDNATTAVYTVSGMTCGHCVASVTEEVSEIAGVRSVDVDLATGKVTEIGRASCRERV